MLILQRPKWRHRKKHGALHLGCSLSASKKMSDLMGTEGPWRFFLSSWLRPVCINTGTACVPHYHLELSVGVILVEFFFYGALVKISL